MNLQEIIKRAEESGSYLITATIKDKNKKENDLYHYVICQGFSKDDMLPSVAQVIIQIKGMLSDESTTDIKNTKNVKNKKIIKK